MVAVVPGRYRRPVVRPKSGEGLGYGFVQHLRRHVERVLCLVQVMDDDGAALEGHQGNLTYSYFVRLWISDKPSW